MPTLILLRHAKSDWPAGVRDIDRPLAERGIRDCVAVAEALANKNLRVDRSVVSTAKRTRETFERVFAAAGYIPEHDFESRIYEANVQNLLDVIHEQESDTVMLVGHGPGIPQLSLLLADDFDSEPALRIRQKYPTAAIAVLHSAAEWAEWGPGTCVLEDFFIPRANPSGPDQD